MTVHRRHLFAPFFVIAILSSGCDDAGERTRGVNFVGPSVLTSSPAFLSRAFMVQPAFIDPLLLTGPLCPTRPPFLAPLTVVFRGDGRSGFLLSQVQMQFVDRAGVLGGLLTFERTDLVHRFGSTTLPAFGTRAFPFEFPFGCVGLPTGTLTVLMLAADSRGRENSMQVQVPIR